VLQHLSTCEPGLDNLHSWRVPVNRVFSRASGSSHATTMIALTILALILGFVAYVYRLNRTLATTPPEAKKLAIPTLTDEVIRKTYQRIQKDPIPWEKALPKRLDRRYIVVGGSGLVGGQLVLALLANGTPPEAICIVDARKPVREQFADKEHPASKVGFVPADITTEAGALAGLTASWPDTYGKLPLTVFHTAAVIRPQERSPLFWDRVARVNVTGTAHVLSAARKAGASVFIMTSSVSVENREVGWFPWPWRKYPTNFIQYLDGGDFEKPMKPDSHFAINYSRSKALAERLVCSAHDKDGMRTGAIRPGNAVYGYKDDLVIGAMLKLKWVPSFNAAWVQNWTATINAAIAHMKLEESLLGEHVDKVAGKPFVITDDGPPIVFNDSYQILSSTSALGFTVVRPPPLLFLSIFYIIEWWAILGAKYPLVKRLIGEPKDPIDILQPGTAASGITSILDDWRARKSPAEGGIGYKPVCDTLEGMCKLVGEWNESVVREGMEILKKEKEEKGE